MLARRVKTQTRKDYVHHPWCRGIQRWEVNPYDINVHGETHHLWACSCLLWLLEDEI
jgi:hypothetical protein